MSFNQKEYLANIEQGKEFLKEKLSGIVPQFAIVLGSGLGGLVNEVTITDTIPYDTIQGFPKFHAVQGHSGKLILGTLEGKQVLMMSGRYHYYEYADEPYAMKIITLPLRIIQALGVPNLILSSAVGGVNKNLEVGQIMLIKDHINNMGNNPLLGSNIEELGPRFPSMTDAYDIYMRELAKEIANKHEIKIAEGIYLALTGPTYETPAEYAQVKYQGADVVGMSMAPEVIVARHSHNNKMNTLGLAVVTNLGGPDINTPPNHEEVIGAANKAMSDMIKIVKGMVGEYDSTAPANL